MRKDVKECVRSCCQCSSIDLAPIKLEHGMLDSVFREHGTPRELVIDNGVVFRSNELSILREKRCVLKMCRCAYRPAGNGIAEYNHCTAKCAATRAQLYPLQEVFWNNSPPTIGTLDNSTSASLKYSIYSIYQFKER